VIGEDLRRDAALRPWVDRCPALRVPGAWDGFELAIRAVIGQQISVAAATTITGRLARRWGDDLGGGNGAERGARVLFPRAETLADADLASVGLPRARGETLRLLARGVAAGDISLEPSADPRAVREALIAIPGIGEWTAQYVALRALGEPDAFPASDLGLLRSPANGGARNPRQLLERSEAWRPWRAYAAIVLWRAYASSAPPTYPGVKKLGTARAANAAPPTRVLAAGERSRPRKDGQP
jgi:AraC family transcriptional regulator of adaptative response / DNA-3-methyladenine glycosylase II